MVSRSAAASRAVGVRASVADLKHFMCYFCGDMFKNKDEFNLHKFNHQIEDIAYQVAQNEFVSSFLLIIRIPAFSVEVFSE